MKTYSIFVFFTLLLIPQLAAQKVDLSQAMAMGLARNYDVQIAIYNREIDANNADRGNAGYLPTIFLQGQGSYSIQDTELEFASDQPGISAEGASTINYGASANLEYMLFNGGRRMHIYRRFQLLSEESRLQERLAMENTGLQVAGNFLEVVRLADQKEINNQTLELSQERLERAKQDYEYGNTTKLQLLNAEVDLRADSIAFTNSALELKKGMRKLNVAIGLPADTVLAIDSTFSFQALLSKDELLDQALTSNTQYLQTRNTVIAADESVKAAKGDLWPTLSANAAYEYNYSDFEANFLSTQENLGWQAGIALRFNIFDGNRIQRSIANAKLQRQIAEVNEERNRNEVVQRVNDAYDTYITNLELLQISERNLRLAELNFERSEEAAAVGQITGIELREAQLNLKNAMNEISRQRVLTKVAEMGLLYEAGILLK
ncbi:MAG: TolC family protein [Flavobacteriales bacterium]|nr:TolC family protein [Flavobacteriales bacterium]